MPGVIWDKWNLIFAEFINEVNKQEDFNKGGVIKVIPIIIYHKIGYSGENTTTPDLLSLEMKYLHDNGIKVLTMSDLGYDEKTNTLTVKNGGV